MDIQASTVEEVTISDILDLASWNRPRTTEELQSFIQTHRNRLTVDSEIE